MEKQMSALYREIAETINELIPEDWEEFYFNGEVENGEGGVFFFTNQQIRNIMFIVEIFKKSTISIHRYIMI